MGFVSDFSAARNSRLLHGVALGEVVGRDGLEFAGKSGCKSQYCSNHVQYSSILVVHLDFILGFSRFLGLMVLDGIIDVANDRRDAVLIRDIQL